MIMEKTIQGAWQISALIGDSLVTRSYFMNKRDALDMFRHQTRTVYFNWHGPQGRETVDEISAAGFEGNGPFRAEIARLKAEYRLAGMDVYISTRACANWKG